MATSKENGSKGTNTGSAHGSAQKSGQPAKRGFAAMDQNQQRQIASKGGQAAHQKGTAHEFDSEEARRAGQKGGEVVSRNRAHMADLRRKGTPLEDADILVAGIAPLHDAVLVTRNLKHFRRVEGLRLESWEA